MKLNKAKLIEMFFKTMVRFFGAKGFSKMYLASSQSETYAKFCEQVYGRNLCQFNMLDDEQLQTLLRELNLYSRHNVLDIGCGIGKISEYISDTTGAKILGVDFANGAIQAASARTKEKQERIKFVTGNFNDLTAVVHEKYDAIILLDTLYFANDRQKCIETLRSFLNPNGVVAIFYSSSNNKSISTALSSSGFEFRTFDFTLSEKKIWEKTLLIANELKEDFVKEKNLDIYKGRVAEAKRNIKVQEKGTVARTLYLATVK